MAYADIPPPVRQRLASERVRMYHALWHFVRNRQSWEALSVEQRAELRDWAPPRFEGEAQGGIDFLFMHRQMIQMVNAWAAEAVPGGHAGHAHHHSSSPFVSGWLDIPWDHADPVWPMPAVDLSTADNRAIFGNSKDPALTAEYRRRCSERFQNRDWLRTVTLDAFGTELEFSIHGWFHMHWSAEPPPNPNSLDVTNEWLGSPLSSHVNKHFWKLHGWIDDRIRGWEDANGVEADLTNGWDGPPDYVSGAPHSADPRLFRVLDLEHRPPLLMPWKDLLLEG
ncbi:hypothetical protein JM946_13885 [Steroidobacter sp. S1-65]|uniref:Tyrosinase copper-binding domain-containing protein n=1 Tax=Steroidobacter gossypii TaxID=2805490 RepID=A0ABS1WXX3_9GAMM|nr:hypothetical protein [Steroidobacter gossypii]MBM0105826.1 hypothetical protein [Steroidobacter gossypii]